jgi:mono/diheme cytochrome c family protein
MRKFPGTALRLAVLIALGSNVACDRLPGKPHEAERWKASIEVTDFNLLYAQNCSGCHGADGRLGPARPLNDPLYLALVTNDNLRQIIGRGLSGTTMPAFARSAGGSLTDNQLTVLIDAMRSRWAQPEKFSNVALPPYNASSTEAARLDSNAVMRGAGVYKIYCARCHGSGGGGTQAAGSIVDPDFLALVSDQSLRTAVIVGRSDLGKPDWRANLPGRPMSPLEISDVVAWLASHHQPSVAPSKLGAASRLDH